MRTLLQAIEGEFQRYKALAEGAMRQVNEDELTQHTAAGTTDDLARRSAGAEAANSIAVIVQHLAGNFRSRFTDFLTADGEKPWRDRDREFEDRTVSRAELESYWQEGWRVLLGALADLSDADLGRSVVIRGQSFRIDEALLRSLAHADRSRFIADAHRPHLTSKNLQVAAVFLVDGMAAGTWKVERKRKAATLVLQSFAPLTKKAIAALEAEADALLRFVEEDAEARAVRIG